MKFTVERQPQFDDTLIYKVSLVGTNLWRKFAISSVMQHLDNGTIRGELLYQVENAKRHIINDAFEGVAAWN